MIESIVLSGVGGQGLITLGKILGKAFMKNGYYVKVAETHGLSQRGGSVVVYVKYSNKRNFSPIIPPGFGDIYVSLELIESVRNLYLLRKNATIVANDLILPPPAANNIPAREELIKELKDFGNIHLVDASKIASEIGNITVTNTVILGYLVGKNIIKISQENMLESIKENLKQKFWDINIMAFTKGLELSSEK